MDEKKIIGTIKKVMPSVVSIIISKHLEDLEKELPHELYPFLPGEHHKKAPHKKFKIPAFLVADDGTVPIGGGSGFVVGPGLILTNKHVITEPKAEYTVITNDGRKFQAEILSRDPINDVAVLKIPASDLPVVKLGDAATLELGQAVIAIGNALGIFKNTVSLGIVSGLSRAISAKTDAGSASTQEMRGLIQTDAAINIGNSGGPLVNLKGEAVGINAAVISGAQSISFAIPINAARRDLDDVKKYGRIRRPLLGVRYLIVNEELQKKMNLPVPYGALVVREGVPDYAVVPESPAAIADIREKDLITEFNGEKITEARTIQDFLDTLAVGDTVTLNIIRGTERRTITLKLAERL